MTEGAVAPPELAARVANLRDLGGLPAGGAGATRPGRVWRAGALSRLGPEGRTALAGLGVGTVIDLRQDVERAQHPDDLEGLDARLVEVPVLEDGFAPDARDGLGPIYASIVRDRGDRLTAAVRAVADADERGAVVVHCSAGKDRTGLVCALLLAVAGVPDDEIAADYARTAAMLSAEDRERIIRRAVESGVDEQIVIAGMGSPVEAMEETLVLLDREFGGPVAFLRTHGATESDLAAVRARLLGG